MEILILLTLFLIKHFICDFPLQTKIMIDEKGTYGALGGIQHALFHAIFTLFILITLLGDVDLSIMLALADGVIHYHIDWVKSFLNTRRGYTPADHDFWVLLGLDQLAHYLTYVVIIAIIILL